MKTVAALVNGNDNMHLPWQSLVFGFGPIVLLATSLIPLMWKSQVPRLTSATAILVLSTFTAAFAADGALFPVVTNAVSVLCWVFILIKRPLTSKLAA